MALAYFIAKFVLGYCAGFGAQAIAGKCSDRLSVRLGVLALLFGLIIAAALGCGGL